VTISTTYRRYFKLIDEYIAWLAVLFQVVRMAKDAKKTPEKRVAASHTPSSTSDAPEPQQAPAPPSGQRQYPVVAPSTVLNIAVHSLLMITVPFALFFASLYGALDRECLQEAAATLTCLDCLTSP
jgi:hypothetical protein